MNYLHEYTPGRLVEIEAVYSCQRWPEDAVLVHRISKRELVVKHLEYQGYWLGRTGKDNDGNRIDRYMILTVYRCRVPHLHEDRYVHESEMREP